MKCNHKWLFLIFGKKICKRCPLSLTLYMPKQDPNDNTKMIKVPEIRCIAEWMPVILTEVTLAINSLSEIIKQKK